MKSLVKISFLIYLCAGGLASCTIDNDVLVHPQAKITTPAFDTLQGTWTHSATVLASVVPMPGFPRTITNAGTMHFDPDLTGYDNFVQTTTNFTYDLLPGDSILVLHSIQGGVPVNDTNSITGLSARLLLMTSKPKQMTIYSTTGTYIVHYMLVK